MERSEVELGAVRRNRGSLSLRQILRDRHYAVVVGAVLFSISAVFFWRISSVTAYTGNDELQHVDAIVKASNFEFPGYGAKVSELVSKDVACRGIDPASVAPPPDEPSRDFGTCGELAELPEGGESYEAGQPPLYYMVSGLVASVLTSGQKVPLFGMRAWNVVWFVVAFLLVLRTSNRLTNRWISLLVVSAFFAAPPVIETAAVVSNDVAVVMVGALLASWTVSTWEAPGRRKILFGFGIGIMAGFVKATTILPIGVTLLTMLWMAVIYRPRRKDSVFAALAPLAGWLVSVALWGLHLINSSAALPPNLAPFNHLQTTTSFKSVFVQGLKPVGPIGQFYGPGINQDSLFTFQLLAAVAAPLLIVGIGGAILKWRTILRLRTGDDSLTSIRGPLCVGTSLLYLATGPVLVILSQVGVGVAHTPLPRFTVGLIGFMVLSLAIQSDGPHDRLPEPYVVESEASVRSESWMDRVGDLFPISVLMLGLSVVTAVAYVHGIR